MSNRNDQDISLADPIEDVERKSLKSGLARAVICCWETVRRVSDSRHRTVNRVRERDGT
jgi:hypothetical protein